MQNFFSGPIPPVFPNDYLEEWRKPKSAPKLKKIAETISSLTRNAKRRRDSRMEAAIHDWEKDLDFMFEEYYRGKFQLGWPVTSI